LGLAPGLPPDAVAATVPLDEEVAAAAEASLDVEGGGVAVVDAVLQATSPVQLAALAAASASTRVGAARRSRVIPDGTPGQAWLFAVRMRFMSRGRKKGVTWDEVRAIALALPGAVDSTSYGTPSVRTRRKSFLRMKEDAASMVLLVENLEVKEMLLHGAPQVYFTTPHYDGWPYVLVRLAEATAAELAPLVRESWRLSASARELAAASARSASGASRSARDSTAARGAKLARASEPARASKPTASKPARASRPSSDPKAPTKPTRSRPAPKRRRSP